MALRSQRSPARPLRRGVTTSWWVAVALLVAACGGGTTPVASSSPSSTPASSDGSSSSTTAAPSPPPGPPEREYPAGGPTDVVFPPSQPSYELITGPAGCAELLTETQQWPRAAVDGVPGVDDVEGVDTVPLYQAAAYACLGRWSDARRTFAEIDTGNPTFNSNGCVRRALLAWLTVLIHESQADPGFSPVFVASSQPSPCPPTDTEPSVASGSSTTTVPATTTTSGG